MSTAATGWEQPQCPNVVPPHSGMQVSPENEKEGGPDTSHHVDGLEKRSVTGAGRRRTHPVGVHSRGGPGGGSRGEKAPEVGGASAPAGSLVGLGADRFWGQVCGDGCSITCRTSLLSLNCTLSVVKGANCVSRALCEAV